MAPACSAGMIWLYVRLAKSAAWMRLNDIGDSNCMRLPRRVVPLTIGDEFHSLKMTRYPWLTSHLRSRSSWVLLPEPSMPSTMISRPGSPLAEGGASGATSDGPNIEAEAECSLGAESWRLERPSI